MRRSRRTHCGEFREIREPVQIIAREDRLGNSSPLRRMIRSRVELNSSRSQRTAKRFESRYPREACSVRGSDKNSPVDFTSGSEVESRAHFVRREATVDSAVANPMTEVGRKRYVSATPNVWALSCRPAGRYAPKRLSSMPNSTNGSIGRRCGPVSCSASVRWLVAGAPRAKESTALLRERNVKFGDGAWVSRCNLMKFAATA